MRRLWRSRTLIRKSLLFCACILVAVALRVYADSCNAPLGGPCTLPCPSATASAVMILPVNNQRTELMVGNTGTSTVYVILGQSLSGTMSSAYGIPLAPYGQSGWLLDLQIEPDPNKGLHTWTSQVSIYDATGSCFYAEQSN